MLGVDGGILFRLRVGDRGEGWAGKRPSAHVANMTHTSAVNSVSSVLNLSKKRSRKSPFLLHLYGGVAGLSSVI